MQTTMKAQFEPLALMPPQQQLPFSNAPSMQRAPLRQAQYQPLAIMGPQQHQQQSSADDAASMQRQMLAWQMQQLRPVRQQPLQPPYTSHVNPVAQQDMYQNEQVT